MNRFAPTLAVTLALTGSLAWAEINSSSDLRYCLDLKSSVEIAKCAGEISAGDKGKPLSRQEVDRMLEKEPTSAPVGETESSDAPTTVRAADSPSPATVRAIDPPRPPTVRTIE